MSTNLDGNDKRMRNTQMRERWLEPINLLVFPEELQAIVRCTTAKTFHLFRSDVKNLSFCVVSCFLFRDIDIEPKKGVDQESESWNMLLVSFKLKRVCLWRWASKPKESGSRKQMLKFALGFFKVCMGKLLCFQKGANSIGWSKGVYVMVFVSWR